MFNYVQTHGLFKLGNTDVEFVAGLDIHPNDIIINKTAVSPFHSEGIFGLPDMIKAHAIIFLEEGTIFLQSN